MAVSMQSSFKAPPTISRAGFVSVLERVDSFASDPLWEPTLPEKRPNDARRIYDYIASKGHDPARWLAILGKESSFGVNQNSVLHRNRTRSWTNARSIRHPDVPGTIIRDEVRGSHYVRYHSVYDSVRDGIYRIEDPNYAYTRATTIAEVIAIWAPSDDANDPEGYARTMVRWINEWANEFPVTEEEDKSVSIAEKYGIRGLVDRRHELAWNNNGGPTRRRPLNQKRGAIIHYAGAAQPIHQYSDLQLWQSYARYHVRPNGFGANATGNGIMYHVGIDRDGGKNLLRDIELDAWHCGSWPENGEALSINLALGGNQRATEAQLNALTDVVSDWIAGGHGTKRDVKGHQEVDDTGCPGTLMADFVYPFREGMMTTEKGRWFPQTECYVGGGFWDYWNNNGGLRDFGYPLTNELDENGLTVQYFERAVFEFHPENDEPNRVLLRRLGAEALKRKDA